MTRHAYQRTAYASRPQEWRDQAACLDADPELFHPNASSRAAGQKRIAEAKTWCRRCPVVAECLRDAFDGRDIEAIRGGTTGWERRKMLREEDAS